MVAKEYLFLSTLSFNCLLIQKRKITKKMTVFIIYVMLIGSPTASVSRLKVLVSFGFISPPPKCFLFHILFRNVFVKSPFFFFSNSIYFFHFCAALCYIVANTF